MKHNQQLPNAHMRKHWTRFVKTFYNQPAAKRRRQLRRRTQALSASPRPVELLRPVVRGQTIKYNNVQKLGRGFSLIELKEAGLNAAFARTIGISVDHRRRNLNQEELNNNVKRLKAYLSKLVLYPRVAGKPKNGVVKDSTNEAVAQPVAQNTNPEVITFQRTPKREKATVISKELRAKNVYRRIRQEWYNAKFVGVKEKRKQAKETKK
ncbi:unnamed protein product [Paramecium pentaurelia]|uniref:60S ribosomal protein L13 n=1 Tax=Paramecium pentaurelia TaxID=43138 RepID=A0A8S1RZU8_9CILI|nr:unnamed protein product [Paramecium pentaurelia]